MIKIDLDKELVLSLKAIQGNSKIRERQNDTSAQLVPYRLLGRFYLSKRDSLKSIEYFNKVNDLLNSYPSDIEKVNLNSYSSYYFVYKANERAKTCAQQVFTLADSINYISGSKSKI